MARDLYIRGLRMQHEREKVSEAATAALKQPKEILGTVQGGRKISETVEEAKEKAAARTAEAIAAASTDIADAFKNAINPINDFKGWGEVGILGKVGKGLGAAGTVLNVGVNGYQYFNDVIQGTDIQDFATDTAVDLGTAAGAAYAGAAIGSLIPVPPLGTIVRSLAGFTVGYGLSYKFGNPEEIVPGRIKSGVREVSHLAGDVVNNIAGAIEIKFW